MAGNDDVLRDDERLQAYHDGELGCFARLRLERRIARSAELRERLAELAALTGLVRESVPSPAAPDLWSGVARGLASVDAERAEASGSGALESGFGWIFRPAAGALAAAGVAAIALAFALVSGDTAPGGVVRWVDGGDRNVMVLDEEDDVTVIWVFDPKSDTALRGGRRGAA